MPSIGSPSKENYRDSESSEKSESTYRCAAKLVPDSCIVATIGFVRNEMVLTPIGQMTIYAVVWIETDGHLYAGVRSNVFG